MTNIVEALKNASRVIGEDPPTVYRYAVCHPAVYDLLREELAKLEDSTKQGVAIRLPTMEVTPHPRHTREHVMYFANREDFRNYLNLLDTNKVAV